MLLVVAVAMFAAFMIVAARVVTVIGNSGRIRQPIIPPTADRSTHPAGGVATDGMFSFRVSRSTTADRTTGKNDTSLAEGKVVKIWLAVTNRAGKAQYISASLQQLHAGGQTYTVNLKARLNADEELEAATLQKINVGATKTILLVFDVPDTARPSAIEVHADPLTSGALLALPGN